MGDLKKLKETVDKAFICLFRLPWAYALVSAMEIVKIKGDFVAMVRNEMRIYIGDKFLEVTRGSPELAAGILFHEALHILLRHPELIPRAEAIAKELNVANWKALFNIAADAIVNHVVGNYFRLPRETITLRELKRRYLLYFSRVPTLDELYLTLLKKLPRIPFPSYLMDLGSTSSGTNSNSCTENLGRSASSGTNSNSYAGGDSSDDFVVVKPGDPSIGSLRQLLQRLAGKIPAWILRFLGLYLEGDTDTDWKKILRRYIMYGLKYRVVEDWRRTSRRNPEFPGIKYLYAPNVWCLIDTSGSISEDELRRFVLEVKKIIKSLHAASKVYVVPWDAKAYGVFEVVKPSDLKKIKLYGRGGTVIRDALLLTLSRIKSRDFVIIMTDGYIYDIDFVHDLLDRLARIASMVIALTVGKEINHPKVKNIKVTRWW